MKINTNVIHLSLIILIYIDHSNCSLPTLNEDEKVKKKIETKELRTTLRTPILGQSPHSFHHRPILSMPMLLPDIIKTTANRLLDDIVCEDDKSLLNIKFKTDAWPSETKWELTSMLFSEIILQQEGYSKNNHLYDHSICIDDIGYKFTLFTYAGYFSSDKYLQLSIDGTLVKHLQGESRFYKKEITICSSHADCNDYNICTVGTCDTKIRQCVYTNNMFDAVCGKFGTRKALGVRVIASDVETTMSSTDLSNSLFGTDGKEFTMLSQFKDCSYNQLNLEAFHGRTNDGEIISNGVLEIHINEEIFGKPTGLIQDLVLNKAESMISNLKTLVDFIMIFLPSGTTLSGTTEWKAYAFLNSWISVFNDEFSYYPTIHMHEVGHNLGLFHSHDEVSYGDSSCIMGSSSTKINGPRICFNAAKNWQLGWYHNTQLILDVGNIGKEYYKLLGISDYDKILENEYTAIKLINTVNNFDYFISFNAKTGITNETEDGENNVTVIKRESESIYADSFLVNRLDLFASVVLYVGKDVNGIQVEVQKIITDKVPFYAFINTRTTSFCIVDEDCENYDLCITTKCSDKNPNYPYIGSCKSKPKDCSSCGTNISLSVTTNDHPNYLSWDIEDKIYNRYVMSSSTSLEKDKIYTESKCLAYGSYKFKLLNSMNDTSSKNITYSLKAENELISQHSINTFLDEETHFTVCSSNDDCVDYDGCTKDVCNNAMKICQNEELQINKCLACNLVAMKIIPDNYPEEISWNIMNSKYKEIILSGDPDLNYEIAQGRKKKHGRKKKNGRKKKLGRTKLEETNENDIDDNTIHEEICLEYEYDYEFSIYDSFGDGLCCFEGLGYYEVSVSNVTIKNGGNFGSSERFGFKFQTCTTDKECDDNDSSTNDLCIQNASTCVYNTRNCDDYGAIFQVNITTDRWPRDTRWALKDETGIIQFDGGPYEQTRNTYSNSKCLPPGSYNFTILDSRGDGLYEYDGGEYKLSVGDKIIEEYRGHDIDGRFFSRTKSFLICTSDKQCQPYNLGACSNGSCICTSDKNCKDNISCTVDTCDNGTCNNICHPFGPALVGYCVKADGSYDGWDKRKYLGMFTDKNDCLISCYEYFIASNGEYLSGCLHDHDNECYAHHKESYIAARGSGHEEATCWVIDTSKPPSLSTKPTISPQPTNSPLVSKVPTQSMVPTKSLPPVKLVLPGRSCGLYSSLGYHDSAEECAAAALDHPDCNNRNFIMWSFQYPHLKVCGCCGATTCPLDFKQFTMDSIRNVYEFRTCPSPRKKKKKKEINKKKRDKKNRKKAKRKKKTKKNKTTKKKKSIQKKDPAKKKKKSI